MPLTALALLAAAALAGRSTPASAAHDDACFRSHDFEGFRPVDDHSFLMRLRGDDIYRVELQGTCPQMRYPQARMNLEVRGNGLVCGPADWDLSFSQPDGGIASPCIVRSQHHLTPDEVAALPRRERP